jgi:hypothetical protein
VKALSSSSSTTKKKKKKNLPSEPFLIAQLGGVKYFYTAVQPISRTFSSCETKTTH